MGQSAQNIELLGLPATGGEPLPAPEQHGLIARLWGAVCESGIGRTTVAILAGSAVLTACGQAEANQAPVAGTSNPSATGEQTPGSRPTTPPESSTRPSATSTSPSSIPSASQSTRPSGVNTSGSSSPTSSSPNSTPSTFSGETLALGKIATFMGKDMTESARLPWETKKRGVELAKELAVKSTPTGDTPGRVFAEFFKKSAEMANVGSRMTKEDLNTYPQLTDQQADFDMVRQAYALALTGKDPASLEPGQLAWLTDINAVGDIMRKDVAATTRNYPPDSPWGDTKPYMANVETTMTHCASGNSSKQMTCDFTVSVWTEYEQKENPEAKEQGTRKLRVSAFLDPATGSWYFRSTFQD